jgi:hypothetical protein
MNTSQLSERESITNTSIEPLLDEHEFSRLTGRSVSSARRDRVLGTGCPYVKLGFLVKYRPCDVRQYIERNLRDTDTSRKSK